MANLCSDNLCSLSTQSGTSAVEVAVVLEAVVTDDTVTDDVGSHAVTQCDVREYTGTKQGHVVASATVVSGGVVLYDAMAQGAILLQIDTCAVP